MSKIRLVHWKPEEVADRAARLREAGHEVDDRPFAADDFKRMRRNPPDAVVIDLSRLPAHGRDVGAGLRSFKATRNVPLVFLEGEPSKVERVRKLLPDAVYATWRGVRGAVRRAIERPPASPAVPESALAGYSGTPLPEKLGIKPGTVVALVGAPAEFEETLGELPADVTVRRRAAGRPEVTLWFPKSKRDLESRIDKMARFAVTGGLWIVWPKKASGVPTDLTQNDVRRTGLGAGIVDYKICAVDTTYSGLKFSARRT